MFTLFCQTHFINISCETSDVPCDNNNEDGFEEEQEDISIDTMMQNILSSEQIYNHFENVRTVAPGEDFKLGTSFPRHSLWKIKFSNISFWSTSLQPRN